MEAINTPIGQGWGMHRGKEQDNCGESSLLPSLIVRRTHNLGMVNDHTF